MEKTHEPIAEEILQILEKVNLSMHDLDDLFAYIKTEIVYNKTPCLYEIDHKSSTIGELQKYLREEAKNKNALLFKIRDLIYKIRWDYLAHLGDKKIPREKGKTIFQETSIEMLQKYVVRIESAKDLSSQITDQDLALLQKFFSEKIT